MLDVDTFLTTLYVIVDDFCQSHPPKKKPGPQPPSPRARSSPSPSSPAGRRFSSERDFYRYAQTNLHDAFPSLPDRSQFNRLVRSHGSLIEAFVLHLASPS